jgi:hypothetical protein
MLPQTHDHNGDITPLTHTEEGECGFLCDREGGEVQES